MRCLVRSTRNRPTSKGTRAWSLRREGDTQRHVTWMRKIPADLLTRTLAAMFQLQAREYLRGSWGGHPSARYNAGVHDANWACRLPSCIT